MTRDSAELMAEAYPTVALTRELTDRETLLSIDHAKEVMGYEPRHTWQSR